MVKNFNLILSGGGVRSYAHLGVYKYLFERGINFNEVVGISGGSVLAPFMYLKRHPDSLIELFKKVNLHKILLPVWFIPDKFEFLFYEPKTIKLGKWVENQFTKRELEKINSSRRLHILATRYPSKGLSAIDVDMLQITDLKNSIAASTAISGVFKQHTLNGAKYIDGGHWNNIPIFFDFIEKDVPLLVSNLGYTGRIEAGGGRISKLIKGFEISSYARLQESIERWEYEKECGDRGDLMVINSPVWNINSLDFNLSNWQINKLIEAGYNAAKETLKDQLRLTHTVLV